MQCRCRTWYALSNQDEIFHIPQMQRYAAHSSAWDPKITTPPGLYYLTIALGKIMEPFVGDAAYSVSAARATNTLGLAILPLIVHAAAPDTDAWTIAALASLPPLWFFGFLYYTDVWSVILVLTALALARRHQHGLAAFVGSLSLFFRQNNIVWVLFICGESVLATLERWAVAHNTRRSLALICVSKPECLAQLVPIVAPYVAPLAGFTAFIAINGSIVLGDKERHVAAVHLPQLGYFFAFFAAFGWPTVCALASRTRITRTRVAVFVLVVALGVWAVSCCTVVHPFMLADNRHYVFYVWRRIINVHHYARYALVPLYALTAVLLISGLPASRSPLWALGFLLATALALVPSPLIEPRYMLLPFIILHLEFRASRLEMLSNAAINVATLCVFLCCPFTWPDGSVQRFMW